MASSSAALQLLKLSFLLSIFLHTSELGVIGKLPPPPTCSRIECPIYDLISDGDGFDIRLYNYTVWISTAPINVTSFVEATRTGILQLFNYTQGNNSDGRKIEMTAPVITRVSTSKEQPPRTSFVVSFLVPKETQANPPTAEGLTIEIWEERNFKVKQFSGYVNDSIVVQEAADKTGTPVPMKYTVAQYNSPFAVGGRVNEIWLNYPY